MMVIIIIIIIITIICAIMATQKLCIEANGETLLRSFRKQ